MGNGHLDFSATDRPPDGITDGLKHHSSPYRMSLKSWKSCLLLNWRRIRTKAAERRPPPPPPPLPLRTGPPEVAGRTPVKPDGDVT